MFVYKNINTDDFTLYETSVNFNSNLNSDSEGLIFSNYISGSTDNAVSKSYYDSVFCMFYLSGSSASETWNTSDTTTYNNPYFPQHLNKFDNNGSIISIPQQYFGEEIRRHSFKLTETINGKEVVIKDDGHGNLYSPNTHISQSSATHLSSSANYIGNIFYELGLATLTSNTNWSSSIAYTSLGNNPTITFKGTNTIYTREYLVKIEEGEFNYSLNHTLRGFTSGTTLHTDSPGLLPQFDPTHISGSNFSPYITQILFFEKKPKPFSQTDEPIMVANLPRPLQVSKDVSYTIKVRIDI